MNFARSSTLFTVLGILAQFLDGGSYQIGLVGLFSIGLGFLLGILSLFGIGRPADQPYKAPWISLSLGCMTLLIVGTSALSHSVRGRTQGDASALGDAVAGDPTTALLIDQTNGFRLDNPGKGWKILTKDGLRGINKVAAAGAQCGPNLGGFVFVESLDPGFRIAGREQEVGKQMIDEIELDDKRIVFILPEELHRQKAVRCQVVGKIAVHGIRYEHVALIANGRLYRLTALGPSDQTSDNGLAFRPFMTAFQILPTEPHGAPP